MNPIVLNWGPVAFIMGGYLLGIFFNNKRMEDLRDVLRAEIGTVRGEIGALRLEMRGEMNTLRAEFNTLRAELKTTETRLESLIERNHSELLGKFADLDRRISHIEGERRIVQ